jgi:phosphoserine phosphatase RsbU/P
MSGLLRRTWGWAERSRPVWVGLVLGVDAALAGICILVGQPMYLTGTLALGPLFACARLGWRGTSAVAGYALGLCVVIAAATGARLDSFGGYKAIMVIVVGVIAVLVASIRERRERKLTEVADRVQRALLRPLPAEIGGVAFASHYQSATPGTLVGGDLYDLTMTQYGLRLIVGDVKGKGLDAVGRCAAVIGAFREFAFAEPDLAVLTARMDARLSAELGIEDFVTAIIAEFATGEVRLVNCGHHPPVKTGPSTGEAGSEVVAPGKPSAPLGLNPQPERQDIALKEGDRLLFYTDGLVEARDRGGQFLALDEWARAAAAAADADGAVRAVTALLVTHAGHHLDDDVLLVVGEAL